MGPDKLIYKLFLAGIYVSVSHSHLAVRMAQTFLSALACILIYLIGSETFGRPVGFLAGWISAIYPSFIMEVGVLYTETLFVLLLTATLFCFVKAVQTRAISWFLGTGFLLGISALTRSVVLFFPLFLLPAIFVAFRGNIRRGLSKYVLLILVMFLTISPFSLGSWLVLHKIQIVSQDEINVFTYHLPALINAFVAPEKLESLPSEEFESQAALVKGFFDPLEPLRAFLTLYSRPHHLLYFQDPINNSQVITSFLRGEIGVKDLLPVISRWKFWGKLALLIIHYSTLFAAVVGMIRTREYWRRALVLYLTIAYFTLVYTVTYAIPRFSFVLVPYFLIFACAALLPRAHKLNQWLASAQMA